MIAFLAASNIEPALRRRIYRAWCSAYGVTPLRGDLDDVAPPRRTVKQASLDFDHA